MAAFLYERKKYCICKRVGGLVEQILPNKQKVAGSSLTEADILRGSAFKFQIGQISTDLNEYYPVPSSSRHAVMRDRN